MSKELSGRYCVSAEEDWEPGSDGSVLKNYLGITSKGKIEEIETRELKRTELELADIYDKDHQFTVEDICNIHELWLGDIYPSAGKFRTVNMEKEGFPFAAANRIPALMTQFEIDCLAKHTPCHFKSEEDLAYALAYVHVEFIIIHPFREGNGRTSRLLADLMALQADRPLLDFGILDDMKGFKRYIHAIHAGHSRDIAPLTKIFIEILNITDDLSS